MKLTARNVQAVLGVYPERLYDVLPQVFEQLIDPDLDEMALHNYAVAIKDRFAKDERPDGQMGFDSFGEAAFESGIVKTMLKMTQDERTDTGYALASYNALESMWHLMRTGNVEERRALLQELLVHNVLEISFEKTVSHPLAIHRHLGVNLLRCLASESFLGEYLSSEQASEVMTKMCEFILEGPDFFVEQFGDDELTWQSCMCFGRHGTPKEKAAKYAPRYYAMAQESAAWVIHGLLCRSPPPSQQFCYDILNNNPELIDLMFRCAAFVRPPWYPESQVDSIASEAIIMLFRVSPHTIPGVVVKLEDDIQAMADTDWDALVESLKILISRPNWVDMLLGVWKMIDNERWQDLKLMLRQVKPRYFAQTEIDEETFLAIFEYRASCRISMQRLVATLTHVVNECNISDSNLISLLRIGDDASQPVKTMRQIVSETDQYKYIERSFELFRSPLYTVFTQVKVDPPLQIADESVIGPTANARLLTILARRGVLQTIPKMTKAPVGCPDFKQITSPESIRRFLILAAKRVTARREQGHKRIRKDNEMDYACLAYVTAAELAAALIAFDEATARKYATNVTGVRRELVLCLGNAAEMALGLHQYRRALTYAAGAVRSAESLPKTGEDAVDDAIKDKNTRRVDRARSALSRSTG